MLYVTSYSFVNFNDKLEIFFDNSNRGAAIPCTDKLYYLWISFVKTKDK